MQGGEEMNLTEREKKLMLDALKIMKRLIERAGWDNE